MLCVSAANSVKDYLRCHRSFLEDFLLHEIPVAVLHQILKRKTNTRESGELSRTEPSTINFFMTWCFRI